MIITEKLLREAVGKNHRSRRKLREDYEEDNVDTFIDFMDSLGFTLSDNDGDTAFVFSTDESLDSEFDFGNFEDEISAQVEELCGEIPSIVYSDDTSDALGDSYNVRNGDIGAATKVWIFIENGLLNESYKRRRKLIEGYYNTFESTCGLLSRMLDHGVSDFVDEDSILDSYYDSNIDKFVGLDESALNSARHRAMQYAYSLFDGTKLPEIFADEVIKYIDEISE